MAGIKYVLNGYLLILDMKAVSEKTPWKKLNYSGKKGRLHLPGNKRKG